MSRSFSIYLDLVRFCAACLVYVYHSNQRWLSEKELPFSSYGHSAVVVFFVLSGYVIAYVTDNKERSWIDYFSSRISRVYSVALPAIILCVVLDGIGRRQELGNYLYPYDNFVIRIGASLLMLNEVWFVSITSFSNVPYWSIGYEFWYYIAFGILSFLPRRAAWTIILFLVILIGPKLLLLSPLWILGVVLYRWRLAQNIPAHWGWLYFLSSLGLIYWIHSSGALESINNTASHILGDWLYQNLTFSKFFIGDYLLSLLVFVNFAGMRSISKSFAWPLVFLETPIRRAASYTFSIYLLHQPLFLFWGSVLKLDPTNYRAWLIVTLLSALSVIIIAHFTENKRGALKSFLARVITGHAARLNEKRNGA